MIKTLTCIECPKSCALTIQVEKGKVVKVTGNQCEKGPKYAFAEIENPVRILTSNVVAEGLALKMVPVRTDKPIPKSKVLDAMTEIKKLRIRRPLQTGDIIVKNFLGLSANLIATRESS